MLITTNAKLINWWKATKETPRSSQEYVVVQIERLDKIDTEKPPYGTKPGACINFFDKAYLIDGDSFIA